MHTRLESGIATILSRAFNSCTRKPTRSRINLTKGNNQKVVLSNLAQTCNRFDVLVRSNKMTKLNEKLKKIHKVCIYASKNGLDIQMNINIQMGNKNKSLLLRHL